MPDIEKVIKALEICVNDVEYDCIGCPYFEPSFQCNQMKSDALSLLKEQEERLRKYQKDKDKLCLEVSEWKHKFHDAPPKFVSQGVVDQICWERDTALSQLEQIGKGLGSKMDDIVALLKEQEAVKPKKANNPEESEYSCGSCEYPLWFDELYCAHCGRRIEWEGR